MRVAASMMLLAGLTLAGGAQAGDAAQDADLYFNGIKVAIDPATGRLRQPTPEEATALRTSARLMPSARGKGKTMPATRADAQRTIRKAADGSISAQVSEDMMLSVEATRQADGSIKVTHAGDVVAQEAGHE